MLRQKDKRMIAQTCMGIIDYSDISVVTRFIEKLDKSVNRKELTELVNSYYRHINLKNALKNNEEINKKNIDTIDVIDFKSISEIPVPHDLDEVEDRELFNLCRRFQLRDLLYIERLKDGEF